MRGIVKCVCVDPMDEQMAVGCTSGKILLYQNMTHSEASTITERIPITLHWHASAASSLRFSSDCHYLFSIGEEGVLVWCPQKSEDASHC